MKKRLVIHNHLPARRANDAKFREGQSVKVTKASSNFTGKVGKVASVDSQGTIYVDFPGGGSGTFSESDLTVASQDAKNLAYDVKVRRITSGADFNIRLFAVSQEVAEQRAKERARQMERIPLDKYREYERQGHAVFRIVSSKVSENQQPYQGDAGNVRYADERVATIYEDDNLGWYWKARGVSPSGKLPSKQAAIAAAKQAGHPQYVIEDF